MILDFYRDKRVFITGHTGFKGTWLCRILLQAGAKVVGYALEPPTNPSLFSQTHTDRAIRHIECDVRDRAALAATMRTLEPDVVFHLAAQPLVRASYRTPFETYEVNVMGTVNALEAVRETMSVQSFVNVTTDKVYENREWCWGYRENENLCGYDPYSNSKSCSELVTSSYRNSFFGGDEAPAISTARSGNVIGGGDYSEDRIIPDCVRAANAGMDIVIRNPLSTRPYQHVLECLYGYLLLAEKQYGNKSVEGAYNFGPDDESCVTNEELVNLFCNTWGADAGWCAQVVDDGGNAERLHEANFLKLDCSKAKSALGWRPHWGIKTAVEKTVEFAKIAKPEEWAECVDRQIKEYFEGK